MLNVHNPFKVRQKPVQNSAVEGGFKTSLPTTGPNHTLTV